MGRKRDTKAYLGHYRLTRSVRTGAMFLGEVQIKMTIFHKKQEQNNLHSWETEQLPVSTQGMQGMSMRKILEGDHI